MARDIALRALDLARSRGAVYADVRVGLSRSSEIATRDRMVVSVEDTTSFGVGVRALVKGAWGFGAAPGHTREAAERAAERAVDTAREASRSARSRVALAPLPDGPRTGHYATPLRLDPFAVALQDRIALLLRIHDDALAIGGVVRVTAWARAEREEKLLATTDGVEVQQTLVRTAGGAQAWARHRGVTRSRKFEPPALSAGWEAVADSGLGACGRRIGEEAVEHASARPGPAGRCDLVLKPSHLVLVLHETVGHATESDRALGYEADFAGTTFATPDRVGRLRYGSRRVSFVGDRTLPGGLATCAFDDEGVPACRFDIVRRGLLVGMQTTREMATLVGEGTSNGCAFAETWAHPPMLRIPNVHLLPGGRDAPSPDELLADTREGILVDGHEAFSIDQQRFNFQFGGDVAWEIRRGKITRMLAEVTYHGITPEFWGACDAVTGESSFEPHGILDCGKGQPEQMGWQTHGAPWARFRSIEVGHGNL